MESAREFYRRWSVELASDGIMKKMAAVVDIDTQVQILEEYALMVANEQLKALNDKFEEIQSTHRINKDLSIREHF